MVRAHFELSPRPCLCASTSRGKATEHIGLLDCHRLLWIVFDIDRSDLKDVARLIDNQVRVVERTGFEQFVELGRVFWRDSWIEYHVQFADGCCYFHRFRLGQQRSIVLRIKRTISVGTVVIFRR